jgi:hypothetical protein
MTRLFSIAQHSSPVSWLGGFRSKGMYSVFRHAAVVLAPIYRWGCIALFPCLGPSRRRSHSEISQRTLSILVCSPIMITLSDSPTQLYVVSKLAGRFCPCVGLTVIPQEHKYPVVCIRIAFSLPFLSTLHSFPFNNTTFRSSHYSGE